MIARWIGAAALLIFSAGCNRGTPPAEAKAESAGAQFASFADDYFTAYYGFYPSAGTAAGLHEYDTKLEDFSNSRIRARVAELRSLGSRLDAIQKLNLEQNDAIDAIILRNQINAELLDLDGLRLWRKNPMIYSMIPGNAVDLLMKRSFAPPPERLKRVIERVRHVPDLLAAMRANVSEPPREFTDLTLRILQGSTGFFRDSLPVWAKEAAGANSELFKSFEAENAKAVTAFENAAIYVAKELMPLSTGAYAIGADAFARKLAYEEMVDTPLPRLLEIGQANLDKDYKAFLAIAAKMGRSPSEAMRSLSNEHPSEDKLIDFASSTAESIRKFVVARNIIPIPSDVRPTIAPTPPYARNGSFVSMDTPGAYEETAREAFYYVTPTEQSWSRGRKEEHLRLFNRSVMDIITIHEAYPGHYVQFLYASRWPTRTRKLTACGTNVEGWAHYAEQMMLEEGFGRRDPKIRLAQLAEALVRDARYVAGIKLHTQGMTVEQATRLFVDKAFMEPSTAYEEARRGAYNPTYLYYTLGKLQIYKLRADYKRAKGSEYSLGRFHSDFIAVGPIPLKLVRRILLGGDGGATL